MTPQMSCDEIMDKELLEAGQSRQKHKLVYPISAFSPWRVGGMKPEEMDSIRKLGNASYAGMTAISNFNRKMSYDRGHTGGC